MEALAVVALVVRLGDYVIGIEPAGLTIPVGSVVFEVVNNGFTRHALRIEGLDVRTSTLSNGGSEALEVTFLDSGEYVLFCDVGFHAGAGMVTTLLVGEPSELTAE